MSDSLTYCGRFVKENDPDRFFLSLLTDRPADLWPLLAFNVEIAKTREVVTDTTIGLIRLQWWRDAIEKIYAGDILQHEVITDLARVIRRHDLPKDLFDNLIYAREFDLEDVLPATLEGLVHYADYTQTPLLELCLKILGRQEPARHLAVAYSLTGLLRSVIFHARQRRCYLPSDLLVQSGLTTGPLFDLKSQPELKTVIHRIAQTAENHLQGAAPSCAYTRGLKKLTSLYLKQMKACAYDPFNPGWIKTPAFRELRVAWAAKTSRS